ncbi:UNVERIFIED_CONTAM: hypothetical protein Sindi_2493300 [Sesamum indicum]
MCKCRSHGTFTLFGLQSSHLNICYYHQDPHRRSFRPGSRPGFCSDRRALLLIGAWPLPRRPGVGRVLQRHPFSGLVDSAVGHRNPASGSSRIVSSAYQNWPTWSSRFPGAAQRSSRAVLPIQSLGIGRGHCAPDASNHWSFAPIPKSDERFARQYRCGPPPEFPLASPRSGIVQEDQGRSALHPSGGIAPVSFLTSYGFARPLTRTHVRLLARWPALGARSCRSTPEARAVRHDRALAAASIRTGPRPERRCRNTKFFHDMVKRNTARNSITAVTRANGTIITSADEIAQEFVDYYTSLLGTESYTIPVDDGVFDCGPKLYSELTDELCREVITVEVKDAIFHIDDNKAPGPDGYSSSFFKRAWNVVGDQVCRAVLDFFRNGRMLRQLNHTVIALVPKLEHFSSVADYRPISCCNVIDKAITKIISDRLAPALEHLIDHCQSAFIGGRNITDNIFLAQEMVRQYSRKRISPRCTINIDLHNAYDSVSWTFLSRVLHGYGFSPMFIAWIMECICTSSFSVSLNGSLHGFFPGKKGLRQGDPMSPALFLLSMEYLSPGIRNEELDEILARTAFARGEMPIRYLGIPLAAQRLSVNNYSPLVDQIANCISKWKSKSLSYAGRLELVRSVIQGVECFWLQVFPLPAVVIEKIHRLCRNFLWNSRRAPVAWKEICHPKEEGGLDIRHTQSWNVALLARVLWNIHRKADTLWVQWVNDVYLRDASIWDWQPKKGDSPLLQRLAEIRNRVITEFGSSEAAIEQMTRWSTPKGLQTSKAYEYFRPKLARQPWKAAIWKAFIPPKYSFIMWLGLRNRLATRDRLEFLHEEDLCSLCVNTKESAKHLFFECPFSNYIWSHIREWLGIN